MDFTTGIVYRRGEYSLWDARRHFFFLPIPTLLGLCTLIKIGVLEKEDMNSEYSNKLYPCLRWI